MIAHNDEFVRLSSPRRPSPATTADLDMKSQEFSFDHPCGIRICRGLDEAEVASLHGVSKQDMGTGCALYSLPHFKSGSGKIAMSLSFSDGDLNSIHLGVYGSDMSTSWSDWSEEKELLVAEQTAEWFAEQGYQTGLFQWGEIWVGRDPKTGDGGGGIRYNSDPTSTANTLPDSIHP